MYISCIPIPTNMYSILLNMYVYLYTEQFGAMYIYNEQPAYYVYFIRITLFHKICVLIYNIIYIRRYSVTLTLLV